MQRPQWSSYDYHVLEKLYTGYASKGEGWLSGVLGGDWEPVHCKGAGKEWAPQRRHNMHFLMAEQLLLQLLQCGTLTATAGVRGSVARGMDALDDGNQL
jgi:hypothetical protein